MIHLFCGYDKREAIGFHVFVASVLKHATQSVAIHPLCAEGLPEGSNCFTLSRFLVPYLMNYRGRAIFCDASDMLMMDDVAKLDALFDPRFAVQVVKHETYKTRHPLKYLGTSMECPNVNYERKNWASVMLVNCEYHVLRPLWGPSRLAELPAQSFLKFEGLLPDEVGRLPPRWNRLVDEGQPEEGAGLLHWTAGLPAFKAYENAPGAEHWHRQRLEMGTIA